MTDGPCTHCGTSGTHATWCAAPVLLGEWIESAMCKGEDMFDGYHKRLFALCRACPVRQQCAEYAIAARMDDGIWGGLTVADRRRVRSGHLSIDEALAS